MKEFEPNKPSGKQGSFLPALKPQTWCKNLPGNGSPGGCNSSLTGSSPSKNEIK
jgi:hypothetical protein